jgi:hypothetical protein
MKFLNPVTFSMILLAGVMIAYVALRPPDHDLPPVKSLAHFQTADSGLMMPEDGEPNFRLHRLSPWQRVAMPRATRFDPPLGGEHQALVYNAQPFWDMNEARGGRHFGDDLNGIGGMNTDLRDPVFAIADGLVLYAGEPSPGWGKTLIVGHRDPGGRPLQSMYAHLDRIGVAVGALVTRGQSIGTVGTANGHYPAHLHFELRESDGVDLGGGYGMLPLNRLDPLATIEDLRGAPDADLAPAALELALSRDAPWNRLELAPEDAARLGEILGRE